MRSSCLLFAFVLTASCLGEEVFKGGLWKKFEFDEPDLTPIVFGGESRGKNVAGQKYCIYLDMWHDDGTPVWGVKRHWTPGTHGWEKIVGAYVPKKPLKKVWMYVFPEEGKAKADFRNLWLERREGKGDCLSSVVRTRLPFENVECVCTEVFEGRKTVDRKEDRPALSPEMSTGAVSGDGFAVWVADSMRRITPLTFPGKKDLAGPCKVELELARRERESFQIAITCGGGQSWMDGNVRISALRNPRGETLKGSLSWQRVGYVAREQGYNVHPLGVPGNETWLPDPLLPAAPFRVRKASTQSLWFTAHAHHDARPGPYSGHLEITEGGVLKAKVRVIVRVRNFSLPETFGMPTAFCVMDGFIRSQYGSDRYEEMRRQSWDVMLDHRLNPDDISRTSPPPIPDLLRARKRGMNRFNILNIVPPPKDPKARWVCSAPPDAIFNDSFYGEFKARLAPYVAELRKHGLEKFAYLYGFDERNEEYYKGIDMLWRKLKADFPDIPVMTTALMYSDMERGKSKSPYLESVDWFCPLTQTYRPAISERLRTKGKQAWWYVCCGPVYPHVNFASIEYPPMDGRILGWLTFRYRSDGLLFWHVNDWRNQEFVDTADTYLAAWRTYNTLRMPGDGILLYPGKDRILPSIRLAQIRDGVEDYEWMQLAESRAGEKAADVVVDGLVKTMTDVERDPKVVRVLRSRLAALIENGR